MQEMKYSATMYIRLSDADDKAGESDSISNQRRFIGEFAKKHPDIEIVSEKVDDGWSGLFDRPAFNEMMADIEAGKINCVITKDLSRFSREFSETGRYLRRVLPAYGVRFIAINDNIDTLHDSGDDLSVSVKAMINDEYCRDISQKTRSALFSKREAGAYIGACPVYGYKKSEENHNQLVIDEYPAGIIRDVFAMKLDGYSALKIAETLNERGVLSPIMYKKDRGLPHPRRGYADKNDAKWSATTILRILKDETYTGTLVQGKCTTPNYKLKERVHNPEDEWLRIENAHDAIIRPQDYDLVQRVLLLDTRTTPDGAKVHLFSGVLICGCCGNRMTRKTIKYKEKSYYYYYCPTGKKGNCKASGMVKEDDLVDCVLGIVRSHISNIASLEVLLAKLDADRLGSELVKALMEQISENQHRLEKIRGFKAGLFEKMMDGLLSKAEHRSLKSKYASDAETLTKANVRLQQEIEDVRSCKHERMLWTEHFTRFANLDTLDRKTVVRLIRGIRVMNKTAIEIVFNYQVEYENALALLGAPAKPGRLCGERRSDGAAEKAALAGFEQSVIRDDGKDVV